MQGCFSGLLSTVAFSVLLPGLLSGLIPSVAFQCFFSRLLFSVVFQGCFHGCFQNRSNIDLTICFLPWLCFSNTTCLDHVFTTHCNPGPSEIDKHYHPLLRRRDRRDDQVGIDQDLAPRRGHHRIRASDSPRCRHVEGHGGKRPYGGNVA